MRSRWALRPNGEAPEMAGRWGLIKPPANGFFLRGVLAKTAVFLLDKRLYGMKSPGAAKAEQGRRPWGDFRSGPRPGLPS